MKGTLFSADFVKDVNGNTRLLEINTDTVVTTSKISEIDLTQFFTILSTNNIEELVIIYKPWLHEQLVGYIKEKVNTQATFITTITEVQEELNSIYPSTVTDSDTKFILRLAYDESAIFDSTYTKGTLNTLKLFNEYSGSNYTAGFYHSSSINGVTDTLDRELNIEAIPDAVIKDSTELHNPIDFFKIGAPIEGETNQERWDKFILENKSESKLIQQYHFKLEELNNSNHITSIRSFHIVYGSNLDVITLLGYKVPAIFEKPTSISSEINNASYSNKLQDKHYYEYTTNFIKYGFNGIFDEHSVLLSDGSYKTFKDVAVGDSITSYYLSGSPQIESSYDYMEWNSTGSAFPSGSFVTSSAVVFKETKELNYNGLIELIVDTDSIFCGSAKQFLVYESSSNLTKYLSVNGIDPNDHYFYDISGSLIDIDEVNFYVTEESGQSIVELDVEDTDTYIISGSTSFNSIVAHNAPCFVEGTLIHTDTGYKPIETVNVGEIVTTYNHETKVNEFKEVEQIISKKVNETVKYIFENGETLECTLDHPIYSIEKGYVSYKPSLTAEMYGLKVEQAIENLSIKTVDSNEGVKIASIELLEGSQIVYNLKRVSGNHNFYANKFLAHNRSCFIAGTEIYLSNGDIKNIEDISIGDSVLSYNTSTNKIEEKEVVNINQPIHNDLVTYTFSNFSSITCTFDHPLFTEDLKLVSYNPDLTNSRYNLGEKVNQVNLGDKVKLVQGGTAYINSITEHPLEEVQTYIFSVEDNNNFYANGILVHNK